MGSISALQTACEDVNTVNCIHALLDTAAQMGCRTPLEQIVQVAHIHSAPCSCRQHDYFRAREHSQNHILVVLKTHRGKQCGMGETHPERHGIFPSVPTPHFMNKTFLHKNV